MKHLIKFTFLLLLPAMFCSFSQAQTTAANSKKEIKQNAKWFKKKEWLNGLKIQPHSSVNQQEFARQYKANKALWDKAFAYLKETDLETVAPAKYPIDGDNLFATVTDAPTKTMDKVTWESHRNYIDIHYLIRGKEKIGLASAPEAKVTNPYNETRDLANYDASTPGRYHVAGQDTFFICFPNDAHRPGIIVEGYETVKKVVIKIRAAK